VYYFGRSCLCCKKRQPAFYGPFANGPYKEQPEPVTYFYVMHPHSRRCSRHHLKTGEAFCYIRSTVESSGKDSRRKADCIASLKHLNRIEHEPRGRYSSAALYG
jgi:hypothetical protein